MTARLVDLAVAVALGFMASGLLLLLADTLPQLPFGVLWLVSAYGVHLVRKGRRNESR